MDQISDALKGPIALPGIPPAAIDDHMRRQMKQLLDSQPAIRMQWPEDLGFRTLKRKGS